MNIFEKYPNSTFPQGLPEDSGLFPLRERIVELFHFLDGLGDPHFEYELDRDVNARLWEMMVAKILKVEGYEPKSTFHGPDFVVEQEGRRVFIEAICPGAGDEGNPNSVSADSSWSSNSSECFCTTDCLAYPQRTRGEKAEIHTVSRRVDSVSERRLYYRC